MGNCCDSAESRKYFGSKNMKHQLIIESKLELTEDEKELRSRANQIISESNVQDINSNIRDVLEGLNIKDYGDDPVNSKDGRFILLMSMNLSVKKLLEKDFKDT